jgi:hypothetical protein
MMFMLNKCLDMHAATIAKLAKDVLAGRDMRIGGDTTDMIVDCCTGRQLWLVPGKQECFLARCLHPVACAVSECRVYSAGLL